jgi:hypothetical protein
VLLYLCMLHHVLFVDVQAQADRGPVSIAFCDEITGEGMDRSAKTNTVPHIHFMLSIAMLRDMHIHSKLS